MSTDMEKDYEIQNSQQTWKRKVLEEPVSLHKSSTDLTTNITFFFATSGNLMIKFTVRCIYGFSSTSFVINFPAGTSILFFIL